jgi:hypothetical protein
MRTAKMCSGELRDAWREQKLDLQAVIVQTETGYVVEARLTSKSSQKNK